VDGTSARIRPRRLLGHIGAAGLATPISLFSDLSLSGQVNLLTSDSFDRPGQMFGASSSRNVAYVAVNTEAAGGSWAMQGAMTQGDLSSWIVAGSYKSIRSSNHAYEMALSYSTQQYDGGNASALAAIRDNARNAGAVYGFDEWTLSPRLVVGYGTGFQRYDYLDGSGLWSPRLTITLPLNGVRVKALASQRAVVPGAEEFAPSMTGVWLPPERTFSSLAADGVFRPEQTRHFQIALERDLDAGVTVAVRGFTQRIDDQLVEVFGVDIPGRPETPLGHYLVGTRRRHQRAGLGRQHGFRKSPAIFAVRSSTQSPPRTGCRVRMSRMQMRRSDCAQRRWAQVRMSYDLQSTLEAMVPRTADAYLRDLSHQHRVLGRQHRRAWQTGIQQPIPRSSESVAAIPAVLPTPIGKCSSTSAICSARPKPRRLRTTKP
jgi:hypothetical protein